MGIRLPVSSKLLPKPGNLMYLAEVAMLTRLATGVARVLENRPSQQKDPNMTEGQKKQAMAERFFVEIFGTMGYMACLHFGQDVVDKIHNRLASTRNGDLLGEVEKASMHEKPTFARFAKNLKVDVHDLEDKIKKSVKEVYSGSTKDLVYKTLYEQEVKVGNEKKVLPKAGMATVKGQIKEQLKDKAASLGDEALDKAFNDIVHEVEPLKKLAQRGNNLAILGIVTGVAASAIVGGSVTQWMNDRLVAPSAKKFFSRKDSKKTPVSVTPPAGATPKAVPQPAQFGQPTTVANKPLSLLSAAPPMPPAINATPPVYLPNPKFQPPNTLFAARIQRPMPYPTSSGGTGGLL